MLFLNFDGSSTIRNIPKHVLGFSTDSSAVIKKIGTLLYRKRSKKRNKNVIISYLILKEIYTKEIFKSLIE